MWHNLPDTQSKPLAISAPEAARLLGVSKPTIYQYINREGFPSFKLGGRTLVSAEGLREWVKAQPKAERWLKFEQSHKKGSSGDNR
ncbi:DNA-binding protein [Pseudoflavonifractor sp. 524-17]|nr:DNA-binding protein [Pseudoflavonifractor sp. 524-17]